MKQEMYLRANMKKGFSFYQLFISIILCSISIHGMEHKSRKYGNKLIKTIKADIKTLIQEQTPRKVHPEIEEIESPLVLQEKQQRFQQRLNAIMKNSEQLDTFIATLPSHKQVEWNIKQSSMIEPYKAQLTPIIQNNIKNRWRQHGKTIIQFSKQAVVAGITSALISFMYQEAKIGTGNLEKLSTNELLISALTSLAANLIASSSKLLLNMPVTETLLSTKGSNILEQAIITPSIRSKDYEFTISPRGLIKSWLIGEAIATINAIFTDNDEVMQALKNINVRQVLLCKEITPTSNPLVATIVPKAQNIIRNEKLALVLTEIGWVCFQSATLGGLLWAAGLGYAGTSAGESINYAMLLGMMQGTFANLAALMNKTTPGAILTITAVPLNQQIVTITGATITATSQTSLTALFQAISIEATNFIINESEKYGGLWELLKKGKNALGAAISSRWSNVWGSITETFATIQEIEPLSI